MEVIQLNVYELAQMIVPNDASQSDFVQKLEQFVQEKIEEKIFPLHTRIEKLEADVKKKAAKNEGN